MASSQSLSTQPFSDVSQPGADLEQLILSLPQTGGSRLPPDLTFVRVFARSCMYKRYLSICTYPDNTPATVLDHNVLAIFQSTRSTACDIQIPAIGEDFAAINLRLHFDPSQDSFTAQNTSREAALLIQPTKLSASSQYIPPGGNIRLQPGTWSILTSLLPGTSGLSTVLLDLYLRPRNFWVMSEATPIKGSGSKRARTRTQKGSLVKKQKAPSGDRQIQISATSHLVLEAGDGETVYLTGQNRNDNYHITRRDQLASTRSASLYTADYSLRPGQVIVTKTLKIGRGAHITAEQWRREVTTHEAIGRHPCIILLYGSDARSFTLYMEFINSPSLEKQINGSDMCTCPNAAFTILSDIADALRYIHTSNLVHNDIKPSNILYSTTRGAILIDFGLGGPAGEINNGGTPWYLPPEYMAERTRGTPGDVFALGVTLLWVLQKCSLPDKNEEWLIRDIHESRFESRLRAGGKMRSWLSRVDNMRSKLSQSERDLEYVVRRMLRKEGRSTAADVVEHLKSVLL